MQDFRELRLCIFAALQLCAGFPFPHLVRISVRPSPYVLPSAPYAHTIPAPRAYKPLRVSSRTPASRFRALRQHLHSRTSPALHIAPRTVLTILV